MDLRELRRMPAGHERIGQHDQVILQVVARFARNRDAIRVGVWHSQQLGLGAAIRAHAGVAICRPECAGTHAETCG